MCCKKANKPQRGKLLIISAPSGTGKSTIIGELMKDPALRLEFSISATTRNPREGEEHGVHYYFLSVEEFREHIVKEEFAEYEEVYAGRFYGTLKSEIERIISKGNNVVLDIDVKGALNVKRLYGDKALSIFIMPPSVQVLRERLLSRGTDSIEEIERRVSKAEYELSFAPQFDRVVVNDVLDIAVADAHELITEFIGGLN